MTSKNITSVEREITNRGIVYVMCPTMDISKTARDKEALGYKTICATMKIHKNLRGKMDLHGNPYTGSKFLYVSLTKN